MSAINNIRLALIQMAIGKNKLDNINHALSLIKDAKQKGSNLIVLPECFNSPYGTNYLTMFVMRVEYFNQFAEEVPNGETCQALSKAAKENSIFLVGGSIPEREGSKLYNTCTVWNSEGTLIAKYRKVHLFDICIPGGITFKESEILKPGNGPTVFNFGSLKVGLGICYDLRFQEFAAIYRDLGVDLLLYPGAFNMTTGPLHWELLLRGRAVDNQMYVAGCCGARDESADYIAWGHSMLVDPWGKLITKAEAEEKSLIADIDLNVCKNMREQIPIRSQQRKDIYEILYKSHM